MEINYSKKQVEQIIRSYHSWLGDAGVVQDIANQETLSEVKVANPFLEDADYEDFSVLVNHFFAEYVSQDEEGHPKFIPFDDVLEEISNPLAKGSL